MAGHEPGCERLDYHLKPINRIDNRPRKGEVVTWKRVMAGMVAALIVALVGGAVGASFSDFVSGSVRESRIGTVETEAALARTDRANMRGQISDLRQKWSEDFGKMRGEVMGALGKISGQIEDLQAHQRGK